MASTSKQKGFFGAAILAGVAFALISLPGNVLGQGTGNSKARALKNMDVRVNGQTAVTKAAGKTTAQLQSNAQTQQATIATGIKNFKAKVIGGEVTVSPITGAVEVVRGTQPLSAAAPGRSGVEIVRSFLSDHRAMYGLSENEVSQLHFIGESISQGSGLRMVRVEQMVNGRPVFQSETRVTMDREGRIARSVGLMVPNASASAAPLTGLISAKDALKSAMASVNISANPAEMSLANTAADGAKTEVVTKDSAISGNVHSEIVYFSVAPGVLVPAWSQVTFTSGPADWYTVVDARTGSLLWRKNIRANASTHDARFRVYVQADGVTPADNPAPQSPSTAAVGAGTQFPEIAPTIVSMFTAQNIVASPNGWIDDCPGGVCTANETQTIGNNVHAYMDRVGFGNANVPDTAASSVIDGNGKPTGNPDANTRNRDFLGTSPRDFQNGYLPPPQGGDPEAGQTATGDGNNGTTPIDSFRRGMLTQLFYVVNWYHDRLYALGFDEAAGNFQATNFSGNGLGGDRVLAEGQDSGSVDNANFSTPPDGQSGRAQMYRFTGPTIDRDGSLDTEVLIHELTHGTSNRLIGNGAGLNFDPGGGMGEGWSDFYALSLLNNTNADDPSGKYASGAYATYKLAFPNISPAFLDNYVYGIRRFPYSTDNTVNPLTWADVDDVTNNLSGGIAPDPLGFNGSGAGEVHNVGEVWCLTLWEVRSRIIANPAGANGDVPTGNNTMLQLVTDALKMTPINPTYLDARDALFDADGATNANANEESIWSGFADRGLGYNARVSTAFGFAPIASHQGIAESFSVPYLDVQSVAVDDSDGNNNGAIDPAEPIRITVTLKNPWRNASKNVAGATATLSSSTPGITIYDDSSTYPAIPAQGNAAGDSFLITVAPSVSCGQSLKFTITSTSSLGTTSVDFVLRVGTATGTSAPISYTGSPGALAIPDERPRGVTHALNIADDLEIANLKVRIDSLPHTYPGDLTFEIRGPNGYGLDLLTFLGGATGEGGGNNITNMVFDDSAINDPLLAVDAQAPYTGSWLPITNSPTWAAVDFGPADPVGALSRFNTTGTQGTWTVLVSDQAELDTGTLNAWSLIVETTVFNCAIFTPSVVVSGTQTVAGTFTVGSTVTYTVVLTNSGSGAQTDNAGHEFEETLPAGLTLVNVTASGGAVAQNGNTATWDGGLAPLGGSVTINFQASINSGTEGTTISAQGTINYDANADGTNDTATTTDDPSVGGSNDPTSFTVASAPPSGSLGDRVWSDGDSDGVQDSGEPGLNGVTVELLNSGSTVIAATTTSGDGNYTFSGLAAGTYTVRVTQPSGSLPTYDLDGTGTANQATVTLIAGQTRTDVDFGYRLNVTPTTGRHLLNLSSRGKVNSGDNVMIGGFILRNPQGQNGGSKRILIRGKGPSLAVPGPLPDPVLGLYQGGTLIATNDNWRDSQQAEIQATGLAPSDDHESAILLTVNFGGAFGNGAYTAILQAKQGTNPGIGLIEVYDVNTAGVAHLINLSTRAFISTGDDVLIGGIIVGSGQPNSILFRALGPSLQLHGIGDSLNDPQLDIYDGNGIHIAHNDNWKEEPDGVSNSTRTAQITATGLAPGNDSESAILLTPSPGVYTAIVRGVNGTTGIGLVEVYRLGPP